MNAFARITLYALSAGNLLLGASQAFAAETVQCSDLTGPAPHSFSCQIHEPNVRQPSESFPQIVLHGGDQVYFTAHGCAQTGGHGKTWKRYLNPSGDESDKYYHGLISIPGVTNGLEQMSKYNAKYLVMPRSVGAVPLVLGYSDENGGYGDNGYWGHDDGDGDQCKGVENAWIEIQVSRACENVVKLPNGSIESCSYAKAPSAPLR